MRKELLLSALLAAPFVKPAFCQIELKSAADALKIALANDVERSLELQSAQEGVRLAKKNVGAFLPQFDFEWSDSAAARAESGGQKIKSVEAGVTQKIFNGGKSVLEWKMQREINFCKFLQAQKSAEDFKAVVARQYYDALLAKMKMELLERAAENSKALLLASELEAREGMATENDYLETLLQCKQMEAEKRAAESEFKSEERALKRMMNVDQKRPLVFLESGDFEKALAAARPSENWAARADELSQAAVQNSVDIKMARAELDWTKKSLSFQKRFFLPSVSVRGGVSFSGRNYPLASPTYSLGLVLDFENNPFFPASLSRQNGFSKRRLASMADALSARGIIDTSYFSQMKLNAIDAARQTISLESLKKRTAESVLERIQDIEAAEENLSLALERLKITERKLLLSKMRLEQGRLKKSDWLEDLDEWTKQKIACLSILKERDFLVLELKRSAALPGLLTEER